MFGDVVSGPGAERVGGGAGDETRLRAEVLETSLGATLDAPAPGSARDDHEGAVLLVRTRADLDAARPRIRRALEGYPPVRCAKSPPTRGGPLRRRVPLLAVALLGVSLLAGCGSSGLGTGTDFTVESALRTLPDVDEDGVPDGEGTRVVVGDLGTLRGDAAAHPTEEPAEWVGRLDDVGIASLLPSTLAAEQLATGQVRRTLGFDARDVVSFAALESPPARLSVLRLADGSGVKDGVKATSSGEPGDRATGSIATTFPVVLGLGRRSGEVALGQSAEVLVDWADKGSTMGDEDDLAAVAKALDDENVVAAALVDGDLQPPRGARSTTGLVPDYDAVGVGQSLGDEKGEVTTWAAYRTEEPGRLAAAVRRAWTDGSSLTTGQPLSDLARLEDVSTDGDTVLVELDPRRPDSVIRLLQRDDAPFAVDPGEDD